MKSTINKTKLTTTIAIVLLLAISATIIALPVANAHDPPWTITTSAFVTATPNPVGVHQSTTIVMWLNWLSPTASATGGDPWRGYKLDITKPDGSTETIVYPGVVSSTSSAWCQYVPNQVGNYTIVFSWPGQTLVAGDNPNTGGIPFVGDHFTAATSEPCTLVVQQEPIKDWQEPPLPTEYWNRPIYAANREWSQLASNWLKGSWLIDSGYQGQYGSTWPSFFQNKGTAPESPHIMWVKPVGPGTSGGIVDAEWPGISSEQGFTTRRAQDDAPIIMNGKIYYNAPSGYYCLDLRTGEQIWYKSGTDNGLNGEVTSLTQGQLLNYITIGSPQFYEFLISVSPKAASGGQREGGTWYFLNPATGNYIFKIINVPSGIEATDQNGNILLYSYNSTTGNLLCWNSTQAIGPRGPTGSSQTTFNVQQGATVDAVNDRRWLDAGSSDVPRSGYTMNVTIAKGLCPIWRILRDDNGVPKMIIGMTFTDGLALSASGWGMSPGGEGRMIASDTFTAWVVTIDEGVAPYSPFPDKTYSENNNLGFGATVLWNKNFTVPIPGKRYSWKFADINYDSQTFLLHCKETRQLWCYSLKTGKMLWGPTPSADVMNFYDTGIPELITMTRTFYGLTIQSGLSGTLYAYNATTGKLAWTYNGTSIGHESPYGQNYPLFFAAVGDRKIYLYTTEHTPSKSLFRGSYLRCINATDGTEIWKIQNWNMGLSIADGYIINTNLYDNDMYCFGKGPTATTVSIQNDIIVHGSSVLVKGMVTDGSPGTKQFAQTARFPNGVPAMSDADMSAWMEYVYMQQAKPTEATGVEVVLEAIDSNGDIINIGKVTSDMSGLFKKLWTPQNEGEYTIIAKFLGSKSYWESSAETAVYVGPAPEETQTPEPSPEPEHPIISTEAVLILGVVVVAVVAILAYWAMKRRQ